MALTISLGSQTVPHVQVVIPSMDLTTGSLWELWASWEDGLGDTQAYRVRGGSGVPASAQVVLVDVAAPVNVTVTYSLQIDGAVTVTGTTTRTYTGRDAVMAVDGSDSADVLRLASGRDPRASGRRFHASEVTGSSTPPLRLAPVAGAGGGSVLYRADGQNSRALERIMASNTPVILLHNPTGCHAECTVPLTQTVYVTDDQNDVVGGYRTDLRVWALSYLITSDPEPDYLVPLSTWDDFDAAGLTWDEFDALGLTWDEFDRTDWTAVGV